MNDLCDALSVRSPYLYAAFCSKDGTPSRGPAPIQTIEAAVWGNFEGLTLAAGLKTACGAKRVFGATSEAISGIRCYLAWGLIRSGPNLALTHF
jgi:hypothetical protein